MSERIIYKKGILPVALAVVMLAAGCKGNPKSQESTVEMKYEESQPDHQEAEVTEEAATDQVSGDTEAEETAGMENPEAAITLTEEGKAFLAKLCRELDDFDADSTLDETFWRDFLFHAYTGALSEDAKTEQVYREDLGFAETVVKIRLQEAEAYVKLVLGMDLPDLKPSFEEMEKGQTAFYYQDGSYYIGVSDLPDDQYTYLASFPNEKNSPNLAVKYEMNSMEEQAIGTVTFTIAPAENENGFIVRSKNTER